MNHEALREAQRIIALTPPHRRQALNHVVNKRASADQRYDERRSGLAFNATLVTCIRTLTEGAVPHQRAPWNDPA